MRVGGVAYARVENEMWGVSGDGGNRREKLEQNNRPTKAPNDVDGVCLCMRREWVSESERGSIEWVRLGSIDDDDRFYSRLIWFCCYCYFWCIVGHRFNQSRHTFVDLISVDFCFLFFFLLLHHIVIRGPFIPLSLSVFEFDVCATDIY